MSKPKDRMYPNFEMSTNLCVQYHKLASDCYEKMKLEEPHDLMTRGWFEGVMDVFNAFVALGQGSVDEMTKLVETLEEELEKLEY